MKSVLVFLVFCGPALAQTLTPAETPTNWQGYGIWLLIALVIVGIILFVKHNPTTVASWRASFEKLTHAHANLTDAHATLTEKHAELVETHAELAAKVPAQTAAPQSTILPWERKS